MRMYASYETTRTWKNFSNKDSKMILLPEELWSIANNSKSFASGSKWIINNLVLCKRSEIYFRPQLKVCLWSIVYLKPKSAMLRLLIIDYQNQNNQNK